MHATLDTRQMTERTPFEVFDMERTNDFGFHFTPDQSVIDTLVKNKGAQLSDYYVFRGFANIKNGVPIKLQGSNGLLLNPIHVSDVVSSVLAVLDLKGSYKINVAGPSVITLKEICELIGNKVGVKPIFEYDMSSVPRHLVADITNMKKLLIYHT